MFLSLLSLPLSFFLSLSLPSSPFSSLSKINKLKKKKNSSTGKLSPSFFPFGAGSARKEKHQDRQRKKDNIIRNDKTKLYISKSKK